MNLKSNQPLDGRHYLEVASLHTRLMIVLCVKNRTVELVPEANSGDIYKQNKITSNSNSF
jgi:hypothetical protein